MERTITVCDLHGHDVPATEQATVQIRGTSRTVDVCAEHADLLASLPQSPAAGQGAAPRPTPSAGPRPRARPTKKPRKTAPAGGDEPAGSRQPGSRRSLQRERAAVREWARLQGRDVGDKGRLPAGLVDEYRRQHAASA